MAPGVPRTRLTSARLVRLLAEQAEAEAEAADVQQTMGERLGLWLNWTDAIALAAALNGGGGAAPPAVRRSAVPAAHAAVLQECGRVRADLARLIATDCVFRSDQEAGFGPYRRSCLALQRAMEAGIHPLRAQVRAAMAGLSPDLGRMAALDAVLHETLGARERQLLATVPLWLERVFERQRLALQETPAEWLAAFCGDMQAVLLAELELRLMPVEGMMEAIERSTASGE